MKRKYKKTLFTISFTVKNKYIQKVLNFLLNVKP